ncbi:MAG: MATE family efflux transporter, partial [Stomatobaculum sp.]|nr:MATE family efflux transporter [Stomatobaculum sp.]
MSVKAELTERDRRYLERSLNGPVWKVVLSVGAPLALYQELAMIFTVMDTMMAAHISKESVSAVAYLAQVNLILTAVGGGLAVGAGIQISRAYGEGDLELVRKRVSSLYALSLSVGLAMLALILPFTVQFLRLAGTPEELIAVGSRYFMVQMFVMVFNFLNNVYIAVERARGNAKRIFVLNILVILVKLSLTAFFVYILRSGLVMVAVASLCSELAMFVFALHFSLAGENAFSFSAKAVTLQGRVTAPMVIQSLPVIAEKALFAFGKTIVNSMCTVYGAVMVGAMGVSNNLGGVTTNPQNGFQQGSSAIISQNFGAGKYDRVLRTFYVTIAVNVLMSAVITGIEILNLDLLAGLFDSGSSEFHRMITMVYRFEAYGAIPLGINAAVLALLYGLGKTKLTLVLNFSRVFLFRIPVFWFLQNYTDLGEVSVGIVMMVSNISVTVMAVSVAAVVIARFRKEYLSERVCTADQG